MSVPFPSGTMVEVSGEFASRVQTTAVHRIARGVVMFCTLKKGEWSVTVRLNIDGGRYVHTVPSSTVTKV